MELPRRQRGDELLAPGAMTDLRRRLRAIAPAHDLSAVIAWAFDRRTRVLPFIFADTHMAPAGPRGVAAALHDSGITNTRVVIGQWNPRFRPSKMRLGGRIPDLFLISSMTMHMAEVRRMLRDVREIPAARRPLVIAGGPVCVYEPWEVFGTDPDDPWGADLAVTGEEYVLLSLLEALLSNRAKGESMRSAFLRARSSGVLDDIAGLVYAPGSADGVATELVDTGVQRLLGDLDELPLATHGLGLLEPPGPSEGLASRPIPAGRVRRFSPAVPIVLTQGCKFACNYCPIPAYNQRQHRLKSPQRIRDEMIAVNEQYGVRTFFGADDNFFNDHERTMDICETLASTQYRGKPFRRTFRWGTEATVHDTLKLGSDRLKRVRSAGLRGLWLGVEDMTATLVRKGQDEDKTLQCIRMLRRRGIAACAMMMHYDDQPLVSFSDRPYGLLNQIRLLRKAGATYVQVTMLTPSPGAKHYEEIYETGKAYDKVAGRTVEPYMVDGNYVVASSHPRPWKKQVNILLGYLSFYNPLTFVGRLFRRRYSLLGADLGMQVIGMAGWLATVRRTTGWLFRLSRATGRQAERRALPASPVPMRGPAGGEADHALPGTPSTPLVQLQFGEYRRVAP